MHCVVEEINLVQVVCIINETKLSKYSLFPPFSVKAVDKNLKKLYHDLNSHNIGTHIRNFVKKKQRSLSVIYFPTLVNVLTCLDLAETVCVVDTLSNQHSNLIRPVSNLSADNKSENRQNKIESKTNINFVFMQFLIYIFIKKTTTNE